MTRQTMRVDKVQLTGISLLSAANEKREREGARMRSKDDEWRRRRHKGAEELEVLEDVLREVGVILPRPSKRRD